MTSAKFRSDLDATQGQRAKVHSPYGRLDDHRIGNEPFLMFTETMAQDKALCTLNHVAAHALLMFYRAHIRARKDKKIVFAMDRDWLMKLLRVSKSTADRAIAELVAANLIIKHGKRALRGPSRYRLVLPKGDRYDQPEPLDEDNDELREAGNCNPLNVVMGDAVEGSYSVLGDTVGAFNSVMGDTTRVRLSTPVHEVLAGREVSSDSSPPVVGREDEAQPGAIHSDSQWSDGDDPFPHGDAWEACRLECKNGCTAPGGLCIGSKRQSAGSATSQPDFGPPPPPPDEKLPERSGRLLAKKPARTSEPVSNGLHPPGKEKTGTSPSNPPPPVEAAKLTAAEAQRMVDEYASKAVYLATDPAALDALFARLKEPLISAGFLGPEARERFARWKEKYSTADR